MMMMMIMMMMIMMIMMMMMGKIKEQIQKIESPWLPYKYDILGYMKDEPNYSSRSPSIHPPPPN